MELSGIKPDMLAKKSKEDIKKTFASKGNFDEEMIKKFEDHLEEKRQ